MIMNLKSNVNVIKRQLKPLVGENYDELFRCPDDIKIIMLKGSRMSKKSKSTALYLMWKLNQYPLASLLCCRAYAVDCRDSQWKELQWACAKMGLKQWKFNRSPLSATNTLTGQEILFRGLDDPQSIASIVPISPRNKFCFCWVEEASQLTDFEQWLMLEMSLRGKLPLNYFYKFIITFNPWHKEHFLYNDLWNSNRTDILRLTKNWECNEFLDQSDIDKMIWLRDNRPKQYLVAGAGEWGVEEGLVFENYKIEHNYYAMAHALTSWKRVIGVDFGFAEDPTAIISCLINPDTYELYIEDEYVEQKMMTKDIAKQLEKYKEYPIIADSAELRLIAELKKNYGLYNIIPAKKGANSVIDGIRKMQQYDITINPNCSAVKREFAQYCWEKNKAKPVDKNNHTIDAIRYAMERETAVFDLAWKH